MTKWSGFGLFASASIIRDIFRVLTLLGSRFHKISLALFFFCDTLHGYAAKAEV
jgi:hypothetical protein